MLVWSFLVLFIFLSILRSYFLFLFSVLPVLGRLFVPWFSIVVRRRSLGPRGRVCLGNRS